MLKGILSRSAQLRDRAFEKMLRRIPGKIWRRLHAFGHLFYLVLLATGHLDRDAVVFGLIAVEALAVVVNIPELRDAVVEFE